jgi:sodium pump decarboxylase gamma subunit
MKNLKKICIFTVIAIILCSVLSLAVFAEGDASEATSGKLDMNLKPESFGERLEYALQGTVVGMLMIFGVLTALTLIMYGSKYIFYDIPNKRAQIKSAEAQAPTSEPIAQESTAVSEHTAAYAQDDGELAAVITAAIAAMIESGDYKCEFVGGVRVVSFNRSTNGAWNKK